MSKLLCIYIGTLGWGVPLVYNTSTMPVFTKRIRNFFSDLNQATDAQASPIQRSAEIIDPGDILVFKYPEPLTKKLGRIPTTETRIVLVVSNQRGNGVFNSTKGHKLVSCFRLDLASSAIISIILKRLYKNRRSASYLKVKQGLVAILGTEQYRTYALAKMNSMYSMTINTEELL